MLRKYILTILIILLACDISVAFNEQPDEWYYDPSNGNFKPGSPAAEWNELPLSNSTDNQTIRVTRPVVTTEVTQNGLEYWSVIYKTNGQTVTYDYYSIDNSPSIIYIMPVSDNRTYEIYTHWAWYEPPGGMSSDTYFYGPASDPTTVTVGDRTPPRIIDYTVGGLPTSNSTSITPNSSITIFALDRDITERGVNWASSNVTVNGRLATLHSNSSTENYNDGGVYFVSSNATFIPPWPQDYATTYSVEILLKDHAGNYVP